MSLVADQVRRLDAQIDRITQGPLTAASEQDAEEQGGPLLTPGLVLPVTAAALPSPRVAELARIAKAFSSGTTLGPARIQSLLLQSGLTGEGLSQEDLSSKSKFEAELEWLLVSKAAVQTYGLLLNDLLDQMLPLSDDIWYWDDVLGSHWNSAMYTIQSSPLRVWAWSQDIYSESVQRLQRLQKQHLGIARPFSTSDGAQSPTKQLGDELGEDQQGEEEGKQGGGLGGTLERALPTTESLSAQWRQFYSIVRESIAERTITDFRRRVVSHVGVGRAEARRKRSELKKLREVIATALGILMVEGLSFGPIEGDAESNSYDGWKGLLERSVSLMDVILLRSPDYVDYPELYEDKVFDVVSNDPELFANDGDIVEAERTRVLARRILDILQNRMPKYGRDMARAASLNGRPSKLVRFWLPAAALLVSSSTILRILVNRKEDIAHWIRDLGTTTRDFWFNWVVEPIRKVIGTIRHDSTSEIAIMSRDSLKADRDSLERMVVEFSMDKPDIAVGTSSISEAQIAEIRLRVREGDVTPVLRAYERDMRKPIVGAVKGDLVRSLLIQVQKTKVDLEVAISGIDALLRSQELVFGFVGLTPGLLVLIGLFQYFRNVLWSRKGLRRGKKARRTTRVLRKIDKILSDATPSQTNTISYKDHGLLLSEVHLLRRLAHGVLPNEIEKEFIEDADDLVNLKGLTVQMRALDRIRWSYSEWLRRMG